MTGTAWRRISPTCDDGQLALNTDPVIPIDVRFTCECGATFEQRMGTDGRACFRSPSRPYEVEDCIDCGRNLLAVWREQATNFIKCDTCKGTGEVLKHRSRIGCMVCDRRGLIHPQRAEWLLRDIAAQPDGGRHPYLPTEDSHDPAATAGLDPGR